MLLEEELEKESKFKFLWCLLSVYYVSRKVSIILNVMRNMWKEGFLVVCLIFRSSVGKISTGWMDG